MRSYSHSIAIKIIVFIIAIVCFTGAIYTFFDIVAIHRIDIDIAFEDSYYQSSEFGRNVADISSELVGLIRTYESREHETNENHNEEVTNETEEKTQVDEEFNTNERDLNLQRLERNKGLKFYISFEGNTFTNSTNTNKEYFKKHPSYILIDKTETNIHPVEITENEYYRNRMLSNLYQFEQSNSTVYVSFADEYLKPRVEEWNAHKEFAKSQLYKLVVFLLVLLISFIYLVLVIGRKSFKNIGLHLNSIDRLYNDLNVSLCIGTIVLWFGTMNVTFRRDLYYSIIPVTLILGSLGLLLVLSLVKHIKNKTILKHTIIYTAFLKAYKLLISIFNSGSMGRKAVLIMIGYPIFIAFTFLFFYVILGERIIALGAVVAVIGFAAWLALKKAQEFNAIKEGVKRVKDGELHYTIEISGDGEFNRIAADINTITDGLNKAVDNELKSERLKTELITNVSHDIRTPLTSIITYVDLLKNEKDPTKVQEYIEVLDQKSHRLKTLTDDLFEAAKASSRSIPVNYEKIDIVSLITQGLGELDDRIQERKLEFKTTQPTDKVFIKADGTLLWRVIENLLSNIFKYALEGSRVYIDIEDLGQEVSLVMKNISAYELNISADELMERFKRGDESRNSPGSGLGLSIAKSLVEIQNGSFEIEIDGDLFKAIMRFPQYPQEV